LARVEDTLTTGYAEALRLEAEHRRLERRFADFATDLAEGGGDAQRQEELAALARSIATDANELTRLRDLLSLLRARASNLRATSVS
jgi:hypothetical protein